METSVNSCSDEPVVYGDSPKDDSTLFVLPYQEVNFNANFMSQPERCVLLGLFMPFHELMLSVLLRRKNTLYIIFQWHKLVYSSASFLLENKILQLHLESKWFLFNLFIANR